LEEEAQLVTRARPRRPRRVGRKVFMGRTVGDSYCTAGILAIRLKREPRFRHPWRAIGSTRDLSLYRGNRQGPVALSGGYADHEAGGGEVLAAWRGGRA
jgi:hypothetical protein